MSPRAASRLERLGFREVYDYAAGKVDWTAAGLPTVRADPAERRAIDALDRAVPTCGPDEPISDVAARFDAADVVVVDDNLIVLGILAAEVATGRGQARAEDVMDPGPTTVRAHEPLGPLLERMAAHGVRRMLVTTPEGRLLGTVARGSLWS